jgi:hypothetical protein
MSIAHINQLKKALSYSHWIINEMIEEEDLWKISRPNGDTPLTLDFWI